MSLPAAPRRPVQRPFDLDERLLTTQRALRYVRISERGAITLLENEGAETPPGLRPLYPSFAVLQLYLLNDGAYGATYVQTPLRFFANGVLDYDSSSASIKSMVRSLVAIAKRIGELRQNDTAALLTGVPELARQYPDVYAVLQSLVLTRLDALRGTVLTTQMVEYVYTQRWRQNVDVQRLLGSLERQLLELRSRLRRGEELSRRESNEVTQSVATQINDKIVPALLKEAIDAGVLPQQQQQPLPPRPSAPIVKPEPANLDDNDAVVPDEEVVVEDTLDDLGNVFDDVVF